MESLIDIFNNNAFATTTLSQAIRKVDYKPQLLGELGIFTPKPIRGRSFAVEMTARELKLIATSPLGAPPIERNSDRSNLRDFRTTRLAESFTMYMTEIESVRAFGKAAQLKEVQSEYVDRASMIMDDLDLTREHMRLGALQGKLLDSDGSTVIYDYFAEFGISEPSAISMELDVTTTDLRTLHHELTRDIARSSKGRANGASIHALAGDAFYDALVSHPKVERQYENWSAAKDLSVNKAWQAFEFGGVTYHNYRGTDDNSTVAVPTDQALVFPVGGRDIFQEVLSPAEFDPFINTRGQREYMMNIPDRDRGAWTKGEIYSYPLFFCAVPDVLRRLTLT